MKWYVVYVKIGTEEDFCKSLQKNHIVGCAPKEADMIRRGGQWHEEIRLLFPS